jgi:hypothetical protein
MNYLAIALLLVVLALGYYVYTYVTDNTLTAGQQQLNNVLTVNPETKFINPGSSTYSYQAWLYIQSAPSAKSPILQRGSDLAINMFGTKLTVESSNKTVVTITESFPIQKWTYLVVNVLNGKTVEAYLNGKLVKTVAVTTPVPTNAKTPLTVGSAAFSGSYIAKMIRLPSALDAQTVYTNYLKGNGVSGSFAWASYGLNLELSDADTGSRVVKLF